MLSEFRPPYFHGTQSLCVSNVILVRAFVSGSEALSAGPARPAKVLPGTAIHIALRIQGLRTGVFRGIQLEHHPLRVRNAGIRGRVQQPNFFVREPKVYGTDVIFQLLSLPGSHDHMLTAGRPSTHDSAARAGLTLCRSATCFSV